MKQIIGSLMLGILVFGTNGLANAQSNNKGSSKKTADANMKPVAFNNNVAKLGPNNSKIEFIGIHVG
ncbi:MAG: hypothetical protein AAGA30_21565, partial [Planctomycetota bacterium]